MPQKLSWSPPRRRRRSFDRCRHPEQHIVSRHFPTSAIKRRRIPYPPAHGRAENELMLLYPGQLAWHAVVSRSGGVAAALAACGGSLSRACRRIVLLGSRLCGLRNRGSSRQRSGTVTVEDSRKPSRALPAPCARALPPDHRRLIFVNLYSSPTEMAKLISFCVITGA